MGLLRKILEVLDARQFREVFQPELDQKFLRRAVHHRAADGLFSALGDDQTFFEQRLDGRRRRYAANFENFRDRDRLLVGDHRERFEGWEREPRRRARFQILAYELMILRTRGDSPSARDLAGL